VSAEKYVALAYLVVFLCVAVYVAIMALKVERLEREVAALRTREPEERAPERREREQAHVG
jgi:CcmD family protein